MLLNLKKKNKNKKKYKTNYLKNKVHRKIYSYTWSSNYHQETTSIYCKKKSLLLLYLLPHRQKNKISWQGILFCARYLILLYGSIKHFISTLIQLQGSIIAGNFSSQSGLQVISLIITTNFSSCFIRIKSYLAFNKVQVKVGNVLLSPLFMLRVVIKNKVVN